MSVSLEELYSTSDLGVTKREIAGLVSKQDYKTINTLFRRNSNTSKLDTNTLNEDVPQDNKRFSKRNGKHCNVAKSVTSKTEELPRNTHQTPYYNPQPSQRHQKSVADIGCCKLEVNSFEY